jgi:hypothetical protein
MVTNAYVVLALESRALFGWSTMTRINRCVVCMRERVCVCMYARERESVCVYDE